MIPRTIALTWRIAMILAATGAHADGLPVDDGIAGAKSQGVGKPAMQIVDYNMDGEKRLAVARGQVGIVEIALGHINRVVTPFVSPQVRTSSSAEIEASGPVLYVQPKDQSPVSLFITEAGNEDFAVNVTLVPRGIPPVEVFLDLDDNLVRILAAAASQDAAMRVQAPVAPAGASTPGRSSEPWLDRIKSALAPLAAGQVPPGFAEARPGRAPECLGGLGYRTDFARAQWYRGPGFEAIVGRVVNTGPTGAFSEFWCAGGDVAAVALWPSAEIGAGEVAEILVLRHTGGTGTRPVRTRPSLIGED